MIFSEAWLKEWVDPQMSSDHLMERLTMAGLEVDGFSSVACNFNGIVVGASSSTDLVIMGRDLDIDGEALCVVTGTCDYPSDGDTVHLSIWDSSASTEYIPYFDGVVAQTVTFAAGINDSDDDGVADITTVSVVNDCNGDLGGIADEDSCGVCSGGNSGPDSYTHLTLPTIYSE